MINNSLFKIKIPDLNPILEEYEYIDFWKGVKKNIIEGYRQSGKWMPGPLWYGSNFHKIPLEDGDGGNQKMGLPYVRDIDWEIYYLYEEARGFSGFSNCEKSSNRLLLEDLTDDELKIRCSLKGELIQSQYDNLFNKDHTRRIYTPAKDLMRELLPDAGVPIYFNESQNVQIIGARGFGKSVNASIFAAHNILTNGSNNYENYLKSIRENSPVRSNTLVASQELKYVTVINNYIRYALENLEGDYNYGGDLYPCPLRQGYAVGTDWKVGSSEGVKFNSGSLLVSRVFADNVLSTNSGRPNLTIIDEYAFVKNIKDVLSTIEGSSASKRRKNNVIWMIATGGYAKGDSVRYAEDLFYNPEVYNCLAFDDTWENRTKKIGYFIPITLASMKYKEGENLITNLTHAHKDQNKNRQEKSKERHTYKGYIINNPLVPSECFLLPDNDIFPTILLKEQYAAHRDGGEFYHILDKSFKGFFASTTEGIEFIVTGDIPIRDYPLTEASSYIKKGAFEIWQKPVRDEDGKIEKGRYIASADVVRNDVIGSSDSLPSMFILDRYTEQIVAEFTGRTNRMNDFFEQTYFACIYFNAVMLYENNIRDMFNYFNNNKGLKYLAETPVTLRSKEEKFQAGSNNSYGVHINTPEKEAGIRYINDWMLAPSKINPGKELQLHHIHSPALLLESIKYNGVMNTDRISSLIVLFLYNNSLKKIENKERIEKRSTITDMFRNRMSNMFNK